MKSFSAFIKYTKLVSIGYLVFLSSCRKFVEVNPAPNLIQTSAVFESEKTVLSAVSGVYSQLRSNTSVFTNSGLSIYGGLAADELYATTPNATSDPFYQNQLSSSNSTITNFFYNAAYRILYQVNVTIKGVEESKVLTDSAKRQYSGEMKTIRAIFYFYLVNLFGDIPLVVTTDYTVNATMARAPVEKVYAQIFTDLSDAESVLKINYPSSGKARINKWTAASLLARVYLYRNEWVKAEEKASAVIQSGMYSLLSSQNIGNVFLKNSSETIWELASSNDAAPPGEGVNFIPSTGTVRPTYAVTDQLLNSFESSDARKTKWLQKNTVSGVDYWYPFKYKQRSVSGGTSPNENEIVLRLAEMYLIRAEAKAMQDNLAGAKDDLNMIRNRAGLNNTAAITKSDVLNAIMKERQSELMTEWGHRWLDLKRTNRANAVLQPIKGSNWNDTDILWPLPLSELLYNPSLVQNPGY